MFIGLSQLLLLQHLVSNYSDNNLTAGQMYLGPLAGSFPLLSLRTNKADVVVGVKKGIAQQLDDSGERWRVNGK